MSSLIRRVVAKPRLILDEMCRLYGKFASYLRRVLPKTRLISPRINGPNNTLTNLLEKKKSIVISKYTMGKQNVNKKKYNNNDEKSFNQFSCFLSREWLNSIN